MTPMSFPEWKVYSPAAGVFSALDEHSEKLEKAKERAAAEKVRALQVQQAERAMAKQVELDEATAALMQAPSAENAMAFIRAGGDPKMANMELGLAIQGEQAAKAQAFAAAQGKFDAEFPAGFRGADMPVVADTADRIIPPSPMALTAAAMSGGQAPQPQVVPALYGAEAGDQALAEADNRQRALGLARAAQLDAEVSAAEGAHDKKIAQMRAFQSLLNPQQQGDLKFFERDDGIYGIDSAGRQVSFAPLPAEGTGKSGGVSGTALGEKAWVKRPINYNSKEFGVDNMGPFLESTGALSPEFFARRDEILRGVVGNGKRFQDAALAIETAAQRIRDLRLKKGERRGLIGDHEGGVDKVRAEAIVTGLLKTLNDMGSGSGFSRHVDKTELAKVLATAGNIASQIEDWTGKELSGVIPAPQVDSLLGILEDRRLSINAIGQKYIDEGVRDFALEWSGQDGLLFDGKRPTRKQLEGMSYYLMMGKKKPKAASAQNGDAARAAEEKGGDDGLGTAQQKQSQPIDWRPITNAQGEVITSIASVSSVLSNPGELVKLNIGGKRAGVAIGNFDGELASLTKFDIDGDGVSDDDVFDIGFRVMDSEDGKAGDLLFFVRDGVGNREGDDGSGAVALITVRVEAYNEKGEIDLTAARAEAGDYEMPLIYLTVLDGGQTGVAPGTIMPFSDWGKKKAAK